MSVPDQALPALTQLGSVVLSETDLSSALAAITRIAVTALPTAEGASVTLLDQGRPSTVASSDDWARSLDELQYAEREGPCLDCTRVGAVFRVRDLGVDSRWPSYGPLAVQKGARSSISMPLTADGKVVGALNLYSRGPDSFDAEAVALAELFAAHAGLACQIATAFFGHKELATQLREAMASRAVIEQAKGILMGQRKVSADAAFDLLVAASQRRNTKLNAVAQDVVETGALEV